jgi:hypothetical protein
MRRLSIPITDYVEKREVSTGKVAYFHEVLYMEGLKLSETFTDEFSLATENECEAEIVDSLNNERTHEVLRKYCFWNNSPE